MLLSRLLYLKYRDIEKEEWYVFYKTVAELLNKMTLIYNRYWTRPSTYRINRENNHYSFIRKLIILTLSLLRYLKTRIRRGRGGSKLVQSVSLCHRLSKKLNFIKIWQLKVGQNKDLVCYRKKYSGSYYKRPFLDLKGGYGYLGKVRNFNSLKAILFLFI